MMVFFREDVRIVIFLLHLPKLKQKEKNKGQSWTWMGRKAACRTEVYGDPI